jgi:hypothetical protein
LDSFRLNALIVFLKNSPVNKTLGQYYPRPAFALRSSRADCPYFSIWLKAFSIGSLEIPIKPPKGSSNSKIRRMAPETTKAINFERFETATEVELNLDHLLPLFGGLASDDWQRKQTYQYCNDQVTSDSVAWALLSGNLQIAGAVNHGCVSLGVSHKITRSEGMLRDRWQTERRNTPKIFE